MIRRSPYPVYKTARSLTGRDLLFLTLASAFTGLIVVVFSAMALTLLWSRVTHFSLPYADTVTNILMAGVFSVAGWFMLPTLVVFIVGLFQDTVVHRIEKKDYPDAMGSFENRIWRDLTHDLRFTLKALALNLIILPFYFFAVGPVLSMILNSYLLGREFFETAASYHMNKSEAWQLGKKNKKAVFFGGLLITVLTLIPIVNMIAPVFALSYMVHVFHALNNSGAGKP